MRLGAHIGISGGIERSPIVAKEIGCQSMQIFSKNQRQWVAPDLAPEAAAAFRKAAKDEDIRPVAIHCSYLINLGSPVESSKKSSREALVNEIERAQALGVPYIVLHPGAHVGGGIDKGLSLIAEGVRWAFEATEGAKVLLLLETAAGAGTTLGRNFDELKELDKRIDAQDRLGFCIDTCHIFVSGMDFRTEKGYQEVMGHMEETIGSSRVLLFHLNDAMFGLGSHRDRHANIGAGLIGEAGFRRLLTDKRFQASAGVLETPLSEDQEHPYAAYERDLAKLRSLSR
jgi:deoxyribonuclease-4